MYSTKHYSEAAINHEIQPIDLCRDLSFSLGNAVKYICRAPYKDNPKGDLEKAIDYLHDYFITLKANPNCSMSLGHTISCRGAIALEMYAARVPAIKALFHFDPVSSERIISCTSVSGNIIDDQFEDLIQPTVESVNETIKILEKKIEQLSKADTEIEVHVREYKKRRHHRRYNAERN